MFSITNNNKIFFRFIDFINRLQIYNIVGKNLHVEFIKWPDGIYDFLS